LVCGNPVFVIKIKQEMAKDMKFRVYLETSIISYLTARPSRDLVVAANQQLTQDWWQTRRQNFDLFISQLVIQEASAGDENAAQRRLQVIADIPLLKLNKDVAELAEKLVRGGVIPQKAVEDAFHIAIATIHGMDYLLTWNFKHIANAMMRYRIESLCRNEGYQPPIICTPQELLE
jgi:predicted nucleic acid-binding protein